MLTAATALAVLLGSVTLATAGAGTAAADSSTLLPLTPDGEDVVTASGAPYYQAVYKLTDLAADGEYVTNTYPNAVDIAPNGDVAAGTDSSYDPDVHIFEQGVPTPVRQYDLPNTGTAGDSDLLAPAGLAWAPDASRLFALSRNGGDAYALRIYDTPAVTR